MDKQKNSRPLEVDVIDQIHSTRQQYARGSYTSSIDCDSSASTRSPSITGLRTSTGEAFVSHTGLRGRPSFLVNGQTLSSTHPLQSSSQAQYPTIGLASDLLDRYTITPWTTTDPANIVGSSRMQQQQQQRGQQSKSTDTFFCGPGRKRYLIAFLCCTCLTIVIGMRSEMLGIITNLNNTTPNKLTVGLPPYNMIGGNTEGTDFTEGHGGSDTRATGAPSKDSLFYTSSVNGHLEGHELDDLHTDPDDVMTEVRRQPTSLIFKPSEHRQMPWTKDIKNDIVENAIFFAYLITSPIGGYLTVNHDSSFLLGCSVAMTCGMNLFLPLVETIGNNVNAKFIMVILLRLLQGLAEGCLIPAVFGVLRFWGPESERSTLVCVAVIGVSLGPLIGLPVCAEIEKKWGWGVVFYIYANLGLIWCIFWWRLIDEKPEKDEKLGKTERAYLEANVVGQILHAKRHTAIPWQSIFSSKPIFAIFITYAADDWTFQISSVCMQSFYQQIYNVDVEQTIFLLLFPFLSRSIFVPIGGIFADFLRNKTSLSQTTIRKLFAGLGFGLKGVFFIALGFAPSEIHATVLLSLSLGFSGLAVAGYAVNVIDLAPNFSGLVMGFANSVSTFTGLLSTLIASSVVHKFGLELKTGWRVALGLAALSQFGAVVIYLWFGSSEEQSWARPHDPNSPTATTTRTGHRASDPNDTHTDAERHMPQDVTRNLITSDRLELRETGHMA